MFFTTGSSDYAAVISIEAGIRFVLFGFLRIGVSARMDFRVVGAHPARGGADRRDPARDALVPAGRDLAARRPVRPARSRGPLGRRRRRFAAPGRVEPGTLRQLTAHLERFDPEPGTARASAPVHSVDELSAPARPEAQRLASFAADAERAARRNRRDDRRQLERPVNDKLGLGSGMASGLGDQRVGRPGADVRPRRHRRAPALALRRRPLVEAARAEDRAGPRTSATPAACSWTARSARRCSTRHGTSTSAIDGPAGAEEAAPERRRALRVHDRQPRGRRGARARRRRLAVLPQAGRQGPPELFHRFDWHAVDARDRARPARAAGASPTAAARCDSCGRPGRTRPGSAGSRRTPWSPRPRSGLPGVVARADFDEDAAFCSARLAWPRTSRATLVAFDGAGKEVGRRRPGRRHAACTRTQCWPATGRSAGSSCARFRPQGRASRRSPPPPAGTLLEVDEVAYVGLRDYLDC